MTAFLLIYDRHAGALLRAQRYEDDYEALQARFIAEEEFRGREEIEVVAVTAETEDDLRRTHGRYFMNLDQLVARMV